ncbi:MAG: hypothetical protein LBR79_05625 [Oscillospiraceae bacterium]|nr:hypothetical protein [Oscillospiraceae bacterium]
MRHNPKTPEPAPGFLTTAAAFEKSKFTDALFPRHRRGKSGKKSNFFQGC